MDIELTPHVGRKEVPGGHIEQTLAQDQVLIDGVRVGYAVHGEGGALLLITGLPESTVEAVKAKLDARDNKTVDERKVVTPPSLEAIGSLTEEDDDDE